MGKSEIMKIKPVRFYQSLARLRFVFITKFLGKLEFCPIAKSDSCLPFHLIPHRKKCKKYFSLQTFSANANSSWPVMSADRQSYSLLSYSHRRVKQGTVLDTTESIWIPASTEYCKTKCAVWGSAESNCAKQSAVQDSADSNWILSGTAPSQTEYCPGQHWVKQS